MNSTNVLFVYFEKLNDGVSGRVRCFVHNAVISKFLTTRASALAVAYRSVLLLTCSPIAVLNFSVRSGRYGYPVDDGNSPDADELHHRFRCHHITAFSKRGFLWIWISFVISSLSIGGFGLAKLIRGGFFKRLKERESRLNLMKFEQERQMLPEESKSAGFDVESMPCLVEAVSVTELTTRELQAIPKQTGEPSRKKETVTKD